MRFWRIVHREHALDKLCASTALFGGRWNPAGIPALYCASSVALCALEKFVHLGTCPLPPLVLVAVDLPDNSPIFRPAITSLPDGWDTLPVSGVAQSFGGAWLARGAELGLLVPSVIVHEECNMVINPRHPDYARVALSICRPFMFDHRMLGAGGGPWAP